MKCHMTFIACQRRARMRLFPLRACGIMFSSASTSQCVCNKSVQTSTVLISPYYRYKSNTCSRVIVIHRKTNSNYHTFELTIMVNEDYLIKWPLDMLEEQIRLLFRRCNLCTTGTVWPCEEDETSALQVALA